MAKDKTIYICEQCGHKSVQWKGRCPNCQSWNSFVEQRISKKAGGGSGDLQVKNLGDSLQALERFDAELLAKMVTPDSELNRVLGGGIVPGSLVLIGGEPGIGKSTLLLQLALQARSTKVLYMSGEESLNQIKLRAKRIGEPNPNLYLLAETSFDYLEAAIDETKPSLIVVDSIQTLHKPELESAPGSVSQIRDCTHGLMELAKKKSIAIFIIGHITKDGYIAGPKILEHMVDTVLYFEGERSYQYRILRTIKNRFGSTAELGIYEMRSQGLSGVENPSQLLLNKHQENLSGTAIASTMEGMRPLLVEVEALVSQSQYGTPQRSATGFDTKRLAMLIAVLEKRCGLKMGQYDVFLNVAGGLRLSDPAADLAVMAALASSFFDDALPNGVCFAGEVGLTGEIRPVSQLDRRIKEAKRLGINTIYYPQSQATDEEDKEHMIGLTQVGTLVRKLFQ